MNDYSVMMFANNERHDFVVSGYQCAWSAFRACVQFAELLDKAYEVDLVDNSTGEVIQSTDEDFCRPNPIVWEDEHSFVMTITNDDEFAVAMDYLFKQSIARIDRLLKN